MRSKNRKILVFLSLICLFSLFPIQVNAWQTGGQSGSGGSSGGGTNVLTDGGKYFDSGTYLFEFVYKPKNGSIRVLECAVVYSGHDSGNIGDIPSKASASSSANGCKYIKSGALQKLAKRLYRGENLDTMAPISDKAITKTYLEQFGLNLNNLKEEGSEPGNINSYGYRILIQKLTCFGVEYNWCKVLYPRKAFANDYPNNLLFGGSWQNDLYTTKDDIGIKAAKYRSWFSSFGYEPLGRNFADYSKGEGYNIIGFNPKVFSKPYDYRPDSLCLDCEKTNSKWSHIYTDMANWEGIKDSLSSDSTNINSYFKSKEIGSKTYACREEIKVKYPDKANKVLVEPGRYFTVGLPQSWSVAIPNFAPITVERTKECHAYDKNYNDVTSRTTANEWNKFWNQDSFYKKKDTGTIKITYNEKNGDNKYKGEKNTETYNQKVDMPEKNKLTVTNSYKLAGTTYQYVRLDSGLSVSTKPNVAYIDLGVANFPVSYENKSENSRQAATVTLKYELPADSQLKKSIGKPNYFGTDNKADEDIYKKASSAGAIGNDSIKQGSLDANQYNDLKHTACVLEYCDSEGKNCQSEFKTCMTNKVKSGKKQTNCAEAGYTCNINFKGECKRVGNEYYIDDKKVSKEEYEANGCRCKIEDGKYYLDMQEVTKEAFENACPPCTSTNCPNTTSCRWDKTSNKYYINNEEVTQSEYLKTCSCTQANNKYYINGSEVDKTEYEKVCPPNEKECPDNDPCCLGSTSETCKNVIYRTIDLNQPFPGYNAENRKTGANWCTYDVTNKKLNCDSYQGSLNTVVDNVIFKNRGVTTNQEYSQEPIYEIELDAAKIEKLRNYNKEHKYSDFTLDCSKDANNRTVCKMSKEVKNILGTSGTCANSNAGNFYTCDE